MRADVGTYPTMGPSVILRPRVRRCSTKNSFNFGDGLIKYFMNWATNQAKGVP